MERGKTFLPLQSPNEGILKYRIVELSKGREKIEKIKQLVNRNGWIEATTNSDSQRLVERKFFEMYYVV